MKLLSFLLTQSEVSNRIKAKIFFGGENIRNEIIRRLRKEDCEFEHLTHEATPTSQDSARVRNTKMEEGVKSIILKGKSSKQNYQFNILTYETRHESLC